MKIPGPVWTLGIDWLQLPGNSFFRSCSLPNHVVFHSVHVGPQCRFLQLLEFCLLHYGTYPQILFFFAGWWPEQQWGWNSVYVLNYLISIPMAYPGIKHSVCFAVSFKSNVLSITRSNYIVRWKYEHTHVIGITIDHFTGKITLNNSESPFHQWTHLLHWLLMPPLLEWNKACMYTESLPTYSSLVCQEHFSMLSNLAGFSV